MRSYAGVAAIADTQRILCTHTENAYATAHRADSVANSVSSIA